LDRVFQELPAEQQIACLQGALTSAIRFNTNDEEVVALLRVLHDLFVVHAAKEGDLTGSLETYWHYLQELYQNIDAEDRYGYAGGRVALRQAVLSASLEGWREGMRRDSFIQPSISEQSLQFFFVCQELNKQPFGSQLIPKILDAFTVDTYAVPGALIPWIINPVTPLLVQQKLLHGLANLRSGEQGDPLAGVPLVVDLLRSSGPESGMP